MIVSVSMFYVVLICFDSLCRGTFAGIERRCTVQHIIMVLKGKENGGCATKLVLVMVVIAALLVMSTTHWMMFGSMGDIFLVDVL